jgi:hypothetical protein
MQKESLSALVRHHLHAALTSSSGRSAHTIYGGHEHVLRRHALEAVEDSVVLLTVAKRR